MSCESCLQAEEHHFEHISWYVLRTANIILSVIRSTGSLLLLGSRVVQSFLAAERGLLGETFSGHTQHHIMKTLHFAGDIFPFMFHLGHS
jgi:hypothetical protein